VLKNVLATQFIYETIRDEKTVGVLSSCPATGITEIAQPLGPIFGIIPVTNPTSTVMFKILIALKTRNPIILSPTPKAYRCSIEAARICYEAALEAEAPEDCIQWVPESNRAWTHALMTHPDMALILATGGSSLVHAAYGSGTPAIGVGPGNVPVLVDRSADLPFAVKSILFSKTFDNGTICASEQSVVVEKAVAPALRDEFERQKGYFLKPDELSKVQAVCVDDEGMMKPAMVGQPVEVIARAAGIQPPAGTRLLLAPLAGVGKAYPLSGEVLAPVLAWYEAPDLPGALKICLDLNYLSGVGHTASIYANDDGVIRQFSEIMNAGRVVVNTPSSQGGVGGLFNTLTTSFTLGCGAGGKNITTENISARHLINIKRVCRRRNNERFERFDCQKYMDEARGWDAIWADYNRNY
jgi:acetaldehyde dehydrogenase/alcohol dehydrogenase